MADKIDLEGKVSAWLELQGFPLEFRTGAAFAEAGLHVAHGQHVTDVAGTPREIDVVATADIQGDDHSDTIRIAWVCECKWSRDKPWIVFCSDNTRMMPSACVAQTIANAAGQAYMWLCAGVREVDGLARFALPGPKGYAAVRAFASGEDKCYAALRGVVERSKLLASDYDRHPARGLLPDIAFVAFPMVVVDAPLFVARYVDGGIKLESRSQQRLHWRGHGRGPIATVDIVTAEALEQYTRDQASDVAVLGRFLHAARSELIRCHSTGDIDTLRFERAPRGVIGLPPLIRRLFPSKKGEEDPKAPS